MNPRSLVALLLVATAGACSRSAEPPSYPPRPGYPGSAPPYGQPYGTPGQPAPLPWIGLRLPPPPPLIGVLRPINLPALLANLWRYRCKPREVGPGKWIGVDCSPYSGIARASLFQRPQSLAGAALPADVDHRESGMEGPIKDQGAVGDCTAMSLSAAMEHELRRLGTTDPVSAMHLWSRYGVGSASSAAESNLDQRVAPDSAWPYDPKEACELSRDADDSCGGAYETTPNTAGADPGVGANRQRADAAARFPLIGVEKLSGDPEEIASIIAGGSDVWVGLHFGQAWDGRRLVNGVIQDYQADDGSGHAVLLAGYRTTPSGRQFLVHNSWGADWGQNGYAWISEAMVRTQLICAYRVRVGGGNGPGPQPPVQPSGACPAGQAVDIIYQECTPACAGGQPAAAGLCAPVPPGAGVPAVPGLPPLPSLLPGLPGLPGLPPPPSQPSQPQPAPPPANRSCPQGQGIDVMTQRCSPLCAGGLPPIGGLCLPQIP